MRPDLAAFSHIEEYRGRASAPDISSMSGRDGHPDLTLFIAKNILAALQPQPGAKLVDIGCGDGTLLSVAVQAGLECVGVLPTPEEIDRLRRERPMLDVCLGRAADTGLNAETFDYVVANGVLQFAGPIENSLREMRRIAKPQGIVFVGELPSIVSRPPKSAAQIVRAIASNFKHRGVAAALTACIFIARQVLAERWADTVRKNLRCPSPDEFESTAAACGLRVLRSSPLQWPDYGIAPPDQRRNYILAKA